MSFNHIVVIGMGYVGIPAAALFAEVDGISVTGIQRRSKRSGWKIDYLNQGKCPIGGDEPLLPELLEKVVKSNKFKVTDDYSVCSTADAILIDVQTPVESDHMPKYESLKYVCKEIGPYLKNGVLIVIESTIAPGTTEHIAKPILEESSGKKAGEDFYLAFSYERVMVGKLLHNLKYLPRIVGGLDKKSTELGIEFGDQSPIDVLAKSWFPNVDFENLSAPYIHSPQDLKNKAIADRAKQMGYDGIKYGDRMVQGLK